MLHRVHKDSINKRVMESMPHSHVEENYERKYDPKFQYKLYAVITHIGEIDAGHYVTFCRYETFQNSHWLMYDGETSCQVLEDFVFEA